MIAPDDWVDKLYDLDLADYIEVSAAVSRIQEEAYAQGAKDALQILGREISRLMAIDVDEVSNIRASFHNGALVALLRARTLLTTQPADPTDETEAKTPACRVCNDTHMMPFDEGRAMCTSCPTPCQNCRQGGNGPYCAETPCACPCHQ